VLLPTSKQATYKRYPICSITNLENVNPVTAGTENWNLAVESNLEVVLLAEFRQNRFL